MAGSNVKILETMRISNSKYIQIVKIGNRCFAMAVCKETVTYLCDVDEEDLVYNDASAKKFNVDNFKAILEKYKKDKPED
jgi:flagellar protein FliO/FliZ